MIARTSTSTRTRAHARVSVVRGFSRCTYRMHFKSINATTRAYTGPQHPCVWRRRRRAVAAAAARARTRDSRNRARGGRTTARVLVPARLTRGTRAHSRRARVRGDGGPHAAPARRPNPTHASNITAAVAAAAARARARDSRNRARGGRYLCAPSDARHDDVTAEDVDTESMED